MKLPFGAKPPNQLKPPPSRYKKRIQTMVYISSDKRTNDFCNTLIRSKQWALTRRGKHSVLRHIAECGYKILVVSITPSDSRAYSNLVREYKRYIREYLIHMGVIKA
jgi:hypothetical protein